VTEHAATLADHWAALATSALLGTDRRTPPSPPPGPLADLVACHGTTDVAEAVLVQVAAITAVRRAGLRPGPAPPPSPLCPADPRPPCRPAAARRLGDLLAAWPALVDEWLERLAAAGLRLPPQHVPALLARHRNDPVARAAVEAAAGPLAGWLTGLFPDQLSPVARRPAPARPAPAPEDLPADLAGLLRATPTQVAITIEERLVSGVYGPLHRPVLARFVCVLPPVALRPLADQLDRASVPARAVGLTLHLASLARTRHEMIEELAP
jgi:hypothetical protein